MGSRQRNKACFANAQEISRSLKAPKIVLPGEQPIINNTSIQAQKCTVTVERISCIVPFFRMIDEGKLHLIPGSSAPRNEMEPALKAQKNPLMLDMASEFTPGGGVLNGSFAQEEFLCYISNLYNGLIQVEHLYPLKHPFIVKNVTFFKDEPSPKKSTCLQHYYTGDVIVCSAVRLNSPGSQVPSSRFTEGVKEETQRRIREMFTLARDCGYRDLVLSALGCGAYHNPPEEIAKIFEQIITEEFVYSFNSIVFAVLDDSNSTDNFEIFAERLHYCTV